MNNARSSTTPLAPAPPAARHAWLGLVVIGVVSLFVMLPLVLIAGCFRAGPETRVMRNALRDAAFAHGVWEKRIEVRGGPLMFAAVRAISSCFDEFPAEARDALRVVQDADVGLYELSHDESTTGGASCVFAATRAMNDRSWDCIVSVTDRAQTVAIFVPRDFAASDDTLPACVLVVEGRNLVVVSARLAVEPLMALAQSQLGRQMRRSTSSL
jgi:hypothetical protein